MGKILSRDEILGARDLKAELVSVPEWGGDVWVHEMDGDELLAYAEAGGEKESNLRAAARLVAIALRDGEDRATAKRVLTDEDAAALCKKNPDVILRLAKRANDISVADDKAVEAAAGKSEGTPSSATSGG